MEGDNPILDVLKTLNSFQVMQCQMYHEKVATNIDAIPIHKTQDGVLVFSRVNLCEVKHRSKRLGCAHSNVNSNFEDFLNDLEKNLPQFSSQISIFKNEFKSVIVKIYALDHKVGNLEHDIAMSKLNNNSEEKDRLLSSLELAKTEHSFLMDQLSKIKSNVTQFIKEQLD